MSNLYKLHFEVPFLAPLGNKAKSMHHRARTRERVKWVHAIGVLVPKSMRPDRPLRCAIVSIHRPSAQIGDYDNLVTGLKFPLDALGAKLGVGIIEDDGPHSIGRPDIGWHKVPLKQGKTVIEVFECDPADLDRTPWRSHCDHRAVDEKGTAIVCLLLPGHGGLHCTGNTYWGE